MKCTIAFLFCWFCFLACRSQSTFNYLFSSPLDEISRSLIEDSEENIYFPVENFQFSLIIKLTKYGQFSDSVQIENPAGTCNLGELIPVDENHFIALGSWSNDSANELWYVKFNSSLEIIDDKKLDSEGFRVYDFKHIINHNGNVVFIAHYDVPNGAIDICIYEVTFNGVLKRKVFFHKISGINQSFSIIENQFDHTYKVFTRTPLTDRAASTFNIIDTNFNQIYYGSFGEAIYTHNTAKWINDSTYLLTGKKVYDAQSEWDLGILKVSINDSILSSAYFGAQDTVEWPGFYKNLDFISTNNIFYAGSHNTYWYPFQNEPSWIMLNILDSDLNLKTQQYYGGDAYYTANAILATRDSGCVMACSRYDYLTQDNEFDVYILKVNKDGLLVSVSDEPIINQSVCELYPNPGKDLLYIESHKDDMNIEFFDIIGRLRLKSHIGSGKNSLSVSNLATGIYLYRILDQRDLLIQSGKWIKF